MTEIDTDRLPFEDSRVEWSLGDDLIFASDLDYDFKFFERKLSCFDFIG